MRFLSFILFLFWFPFQFIAGSADSLKLLLSKVKEASYFDSTRVFTAGQRALNFAEKNGLKEKALTEINIYYGNYFYYTRNIDSSAACFKRALEFARQNNSKHLEMLAKIRLLYVDREYGLMQNTEEELNIFLKDCIAQNDIENELEVYNLMGITQEEKGDYKKAVEFYIKGLSKSELSNSDYYQATFLNNLGLVKYSLGELDKALSDYNKGIEIATKINNQRLLSHIMMNRCLVYVNQNNYTAADDNFKAVIGYAITNKLPLELASAYVNLGSAYLNKKEYGKGLNYVDSAILVFKKYDFKKEQVQALFNKCNILLEINNLTEAENIINQNEAYVLNSKSADLASEFYLLKYGLMHKKKRYEEALDYYLHHTRIKDSMRNVINAKVVDELQVKYNVQKKEIELEKEKSKSLSLEKINQKEKFLKWLAVLLGFMVIVAGGIIALVVYNRKIREKQEFFSKQLIIKTEEERSRIAKDLHDDIGQSLSSLKTWLFSDNDKHVNDKKIGTEIERIIEQTRQISRTLYPSYIEKIGLTPAIAMLAENIQKNKNIEFSFDICERTEELPVSVKTHLFRIIQECISNTLRHSGGTALKIMIEFLNDEFVLTYVDNGSWTNQKRTMDGMGLLSIKERIKIINGIGDIEQNQPKGFKLILKFKINK